MFEGFTDAARDLVTLAHEEATILRHERIGAEHLILGFIRVRPGTLRSRRTSAGLSPSAPAATSPPGSGGSTNVIATLNPAGDRVAMSVFLHIGP